MSQTYNNIKAGSRFFSIHNFDILKCFHNINLHACNMYNVNTFIVLKQQKGNNIIDAHSLIHV